MFCKKALRDQAAPQISITFLRATLLSYGLFDEMATGLFIVSLPLLRDHLGLSYEQIGLLFTVGSCSAMLLEPIINIISDRHSKRWWILGGLLCLVLSYIIAGSTSNYSILLLIFAVYYPAIGTAIGLAEGTLVDAAPAKSTATMTRWTLLASIGDILAPLLVTGMVSIHQAWSEICWLMAGLWACLFLCTVVQPFSVLEGDKSDQTVKGKLIESVSQDDLLLENGNSQDTDGDRISIWKTLRQALLHPDLLRWALLALIPTMVDEVLLGFVTLYLHDILHASEITIGWILASSLLSTLLGLTLLDLLPWLQRAANQAPHRLLAGMAIIVLVGILLLLTSHTIWLAALGLGIVGLGAAGWYPIAQAQTYRQLPGHSSLIRAITSIGTPIDAILPGIVGFLAARFGLVIGLAFLGSAPLLMLITLIGYSAPSGKNRELIIID